MSPTIDLAEEADIPGIAALRAAVAAHLTRQHGRGPWSSAGTEASVRRSLTTSRLLLARRNTKIVGSLRLATRKPWAIDPSYFTPVPRPLYLVDMGVAPSVQGQGIGRRLLDHARRCACEWPGDAIRLDAYDAPAGAGAFYVKCGYREVGRATYRKTRLVSYESVLPRATDGRPTEPEGVRT